MRVLVARDRHHVGSRLGLAIVKAIARAHGGWVRASNRPEGGARVQLAMHQRASGAPGSGPEGVADGSMRHL